MRLLVQLTSVTYASSKRQGVPAAVYGQPTECHGAEPKAARVVSPWEGSDPIDGWEPSWGPGACLRYMEILAGPRAALPTLPECKVGRPSADGRNTLQQQIATRWCAARIGHVAETL